MRNLLKVSLLLLFPVLLTGQTRTITDASIPVGADVTFSADTTYILDGMVFVDSAATLTIQAGTLIQAEDGQDTDASGLVVTRYGKIFAEGTADNPIIFTSVNDDGGLTYQDRGEWGGVVLCGLAPTNNSSPKAVEGVNEIDPARALYGGDDPNHSSGVFKYVSIRYTGINIGSSTGNEIQGLTVAGVGAGTVLEYIESYASGDDGFEFFGGTVNTKYLVSAFCSDDAFDWDQGFNGKHQFWFAIQAPDKAGRIAEMDGAGGNEQGTPYAKPMLANVTYLGAGLGSAPEGDGEQAVIFRDNTGGFYYNSIFADYDDASTSIGITVEDIDNSGDKVEDSMKRLEAGDLVLSHNLWYGFGAGNTLAEFAPQAAVAQHLADNNNRIAEPKLRGVSRTTDGGLDPRPDRGSAAALGAMDIEDSWFKATNYVGAFGSNLWIAGWTTLDMEGYLGNLPLTPQAGERIITDADIPVGADVVFSADTTYILDGMVFVDSAATLTIEPGTKIMAEDGQDTDASGLVVTRHAKIFAEGSADQPIIFTSVNDDGSLTYEDRGEWGGVVLCGLAPTNNSSPKAVEGVNEIDPARALYGGDDPEHSSGVMRYVSIRYTGINIGSSTGNEIQGLTVAGVGSGTTLEYIESYASGDDGFEFFGGTVNTKYLVSAFCSDDAFDWDQGFNGKHQFWFAIQAPDKAGRIAEMDGAGGNEQGTPYAMPMLANVTFMGAGVGSAPEGDGEQALIFRDNTGAFLYNSIITDYDDASTSLGITVEDIDNTGDKVEDSMKRLEAGDLVIANNLWYGFGAGNTLSEFAPQAAVAQHLADNGNEVTDPMLRGISRETNNGLDPRPSTNSPAYSGAMDIADDWFVDTDFRGAFRDELWIAGWTTLAMEGYLGDFTSDVDDQISVPEELALEQNYPNPFNPSTSIAFTLKEAGQVKLTVYNSLGQTIAKLVNGYREAGAHKVVWHAGNVSTGVFFYRLETAGQVLTKKMVYMR